MRYVLALGLLALLCPAATVHAQSEAAIGVGLAVTTFDPTGSLGHSSTEIGPLLRLNLGGGFGPAIGFSWHSMGVDGMAAGGRVYVGKLHVRPVMAGVGYELKLHRYSLVASIVAGYAFNHLDPDDRARPPFRQALGATYITFSASDCFAWRPTIGLWYDAAPRVGVTMSLAYVGMRPLLTVASDRGVQRFRIDAASTALTFGLVYGVF